jgi:diguanylate cyclase (GGDEF)-like protein
VITQLDDIIEKIVQASPLDNQILYQLSSRVQALIDRQDELRERQINRVVDAYRGQETLSRAHHEINSLVTRYAGKEASLPRIVCDLLEAGLYQYLLLTWINQGARSEAWQQTVTNLRSLLGWIHDCMDETVFTARVAHIEVQQALDLINHMDECIGSVHSTTTQHKPLLTVLALLLVEKQFKAEPLCEVPLTELEVYSEPEKLPDDINERDERLLKALEVNDWLKLPGSPPREDLQVIWISYRRDVFVLANRAGHKQAELSAAELANRIRQGWQIHKDETKAGAVDRGIYSTLQHVYQQLAYQRCHDDLTGLINRKEFERLAAQLLRQRGGKDEHCFMMVLDVDQFDLINSLYGHHIGDGLLMDVAEILQNSLSENDVIARLGSNEFGVIIKNSDMESCRSLAEDIRQGISAHSFGIEDNAHQVTASFGLTHVDTSAVSLASVLRRATSACSMAKELGRNRVVVYQEDDQAVRQRQTLEEWFPRINEALANDSLYLKVQKIEPNEIENKVQLPHYEVLLGLNDREDKPIPIWQFIQAAEHFRKMKDVDRWVVRAVFDWIRSHPKKMQMMDCISINLSGTTLGDEEFLEFLLPEIKQLAIEPDRVCFEITETSAIQNIDKAIAFMSELKNMGCLFSLDDFGTGFSSYEYLKKLPVDYLKIDGVFIKHLGTDPDDLAVVKSMCEIGHYMNKKIVAEFVETEEIRELLRTVGVDYVQGYGVEMPKEIVHL